MGPRRKNGASLGNCVTKGIARIRKGEFGMGPRTAKLSQPSVTGYYPRTRLFDQLDDARDRPGVWVTGPAGSGKTTLAASYVADRGLPCLWYTLDAGDADPATWFSYLGMAARGLASEGTELPALTPEYLPGLPTFTRNFFETLCAGLPVPSFASS